MMKRRRQEQEPPTPRLRGKRPRTTNSNSQPHHVNDTESVITTDSDTRGILSSVIMGGRTSQTAGTSFAPLQSNSRKLLRKVLYAAYMEMEVKRPELSRLVQAIDQRLNRTLMPTTVRERMFDGELLLKESAKKRDELRQELEEYAKLKASLITEKRALENDEADLADIQGNLAQQTATVNSHPLLLIRPVPGDYVQNLLRYPSSKFAGK